MQGKVRLDWIDGLRALAILFVIYGHLAPNQVDFFVITSPIKIPLFFAITGYLVAGKKVDLLVAYKKILLTLIVPWVVLSFVWIKVPLAAIVSLSKGPLDFLYEFVSGVTLWYMPCLIVAEAILFTVMRILGNDKFTMAAMVLLTGVGLFMANEGVGSFACISQAFIAQGYLLIGFLFKVYEEKIRTLPVWFASLLPLIFACLVVLSYVFYPGSKLDAAHNEYYNFPLCYGLSFFGVFALFWFAPKVKMPAALVYVGRNTLVFYMIQIYLVSGVSKFFLTYLPMVPLTIRTILGVFVVCAICAAASAIINRCVPWVVGKRKM